jgi:hypothetical protein
LKVSFLFGPFTLGTKILALGNNVEEGIVASVGVKFSSGSYPVSLVSSTVSSSGYSVSCSLLVGAKDFGWKRFDYLLPVLDSPRVRIWRGWFHQSGS